MAKHDDGVVDQGEAGHQARQPVVDEHEQEDEPDADDAGQDAGGQELRAERGADRVEAQLPEGQGQGAVLQRRDQVLLLGGRERAADLAVAVGDRLADDRCRDDLAVEDDGEELADVLAGVVAEELGAVRLELEADDALARRRIDAGRHAAGVDLLAAEERRQRRVDGLPGTGHGPAARGRPRPVDVGRQRHEVQPPGGPDELTDLLLLGGARQVDDDAIGAHRLDDRLGHAGRVDAVLDDRADRLHRLLGRRRSILADGLVLALQATLEIESEARLGELRNAPEGAREGRHEDDGEREQTDGHDEKGNEAMHRRGLYQPPPGGADGGPAAAPGRGARMGRRLRRRGRP